MTKCLSCGVDIGESWKVFCSDCYELEVEKRGGKKPVLYQGCLVDDDEWLWCLHCERFFQAKDYAQELGKGFGGKCPFCGAAGLGIDVYFWDDWARQNPELWEHWPRSVSELSYGMECRMYQ